MTTWTKRSSPASTVWRPKRRFYGENSDGFYLDTAGLGKGFVPVKQNDNFYTMQSNDGTTYMATNSTNFRFVEAS